MDMYSEQESSSELGSEMDQIGKDSEDEEDEIGEHSEEEENEEEENEGRRDFRAIRELDAVRYLMRELETMGDINPTAV